MNALPQADKFAPLSEAELSRSAAIARLAPAPEWTPIVPVPQGEKLPGFLIKSCCPPGCVFDKQWWFYKTPDGGFSSVIIRYNAAEGDGKEFRPFTYCRNAAGKCEWRCQGLPEPRPLYGLDRLAANPNAPVIICEGEKSADAAAAIFPNHVATTSSGGTNAFDKADWKPLAGRDVVIWPDHDKPGAKYAGGAAGLANAAGARSVRIVAVPDAFPHKWDLADPVPEGADVQVMFDAAKPFDAKAQGAFGSFGSAEHRHFSQNDWPEPKPLPDGLLPVDAFDPAFLPESIAPWVMDISDRMQCPPDFVGIPAIVALGSVIGRKVAMRPQRKTDWYEVANLWGCIVGRPGAMKSPAMDEALKPLHRLEVEARKGNEAAAKEYELAACRT